MFIKNRNICTMSTCLSNTSCQLLVRWLAFFCCCRISIVIKSVKYLKTRHGIKNMMKTTNEQFIIPHVTATITRNELSGRPESQHMDFWPICSVGFVLVTLSANPSMELGRHSADFSHRRNAQAQSNFLFPELQSVKNIT